jgi:hypothetical protein
MQCINAGTKVRFAPDGSHVYNGDTYQCPTCQVEIVICNTNPTHEKNPHITDKDICMEEITIRHKPRINLRKTLEEKDGNEYDRSGNSEPENKQGTSDLDYISSAAHFQGFEELFKIFGVEVDGNRFFRPEDR